MVLHLCHEDIVEVVSMTDAIDAIEQASKEQASGDVIVGERQNLRFPGGWIRLMPAAMTASRVFGYKQFHLATIASAPSAEAHVGYSTYLFDMDTGEPLCVIDANHLTALRTGAAAGLATSRLARPDVSELAIIGSGAEARMQSEAVAAVRSIRRARVFGRDRDRRRRFANEMAERLGIEIEPVDTPQAAINGAQIVVVATLTDGDPALFGSWLSLGQHVTSIGSTMPTQREIDPEVWRRANCIVVDTRGLLTESGDAIAAAEEGAIDERSIIELTELVSGEAGGRLDTDDITLYKSVGTGMQDLAVAYLAYRRAKERGAGLEVRDHRLTKSVKPN